MSKEEVDLKIKYKDQVRDVYDVPLDIENSRLIGEAISVFFPQCELKLPDQKALTLVQPKFNLKRFMKGNQCEEPFVRAVLKLDKNLSGSVQKIDNEDENKVLTGLEELKKIISQKDFEKNKVVNELEKARERIVELDSENCLLKKDLEKGKESSSLEILGLQKKLKQTQKEHKEEINRLKMELKMAKDAGRKKVLCKSVSKKNQKWKWKVHKGNVKFSNKGATVRKMGNDSWDTVVIGPLVDDRSYFKVIIDNNNAKDRSGLIVGIADISCVNASAGYGRIVSKKYNNSINDYPNVGDVIELADDIPNDTIEISVNGKKGTAKKRPSDFGKPLYAVGWLYFLGNQMSIV